MHRNCLRVDRPRSPFIFRGRHFVVFWAKTRAQSIRQFLLGETTLDEVICNGPPCGLGSYSTGLSSTRYDFPHFWKLAPVKDLQDWWIEVFHPKMPSWLNELRSKAPI